MYIDKTHTKKDLLKISKAFNINMNQSLSKREIIDLYPKLFEKIVYIDNEYNIKHKTDLIEYLKNKSPIKRLNTDEKRVVMMKCKSIINYCKNSFDINQSNYENRNQIMNDVMFIHFYGEIPSVRRACRLYNNDPNKINHVNPVIPEYIQKEMDSLNTSKKEIIHKLTIKKGKFILNFN